MDEFVVALEAEALAAGFHARRPPADGADRLGARPAAGDGRTRSCASAPTGLRTAALTNNWADEKRRSTPSGLHDAGLFDVVVESAVEGLRKPDPRIYTLALARLNVLASRDRVPRRPRHEPQARRARWGWRRSRSSIPTTRSTELAGNPRDHAAMSETLTWSCSGCATASRERIATGNGRSRRPGADRSRARAGGPARGVAARRARRRRSRPARSGARSRLREPIASAHGLDVEIAPGLDGVRRAIRHLHPDGGAAARRNDPHLTAMFEGRWEEFGAEPADAFRRASAPRSTRSSPRTRVDGSSRSATAASSTSRSRSRSVSTGISGSSRTTRRCRAWSRRERASARSRRSTNARTSTEDGIRPREDGAGMNVDRRTRRSGHRGDDRPTRGAQRGRPRRPPPSSPTRSARSTPTTRTTWPCSRARTERSAPAPT